MKVKQRNEQPARQNSAETRTELWRNLVHDPLIWWSIFTAWTPAGYTILVFFTASTPTGYTIPVFFTASTPTGYTILVFFTASTPAGYTILVFFTASTPAGYTILVFFIASTPTGYTILVFFTASTPTGYTILVLFTASTLITELSMVQPTSPSWFFSLTPFSSAIRRCYSRAFKASSIILLKDSALH